MHFYLNKINIKFENFAFILRYILIEHPSKLYFDS